PPAAPQSSRLSSFGTWGSPWSKTGSGVLHWLIPTCTELGREFFLRRLPVGAASRAALLPVRLGSPDLPAVGAASRAALLPVRLNSPDLPAVGAASRAALAVRLGSPDLPVGAASRAAPV